MGASPSGFIAPGTYQYTVNGTFESLLTGTQTVPPSATLRVDAPTPAGQHQMLFRSDESTEQVSRFQPDGTYLTELRLDTSAVAKEFHADPAVLLIPVSASAGKTWDWTLHSTDGATTLQATVRVLRGESITIGGKAEPAVVVDAVLTATGDVSFKTEQILWGSPRYKLLLRQDETSDGRYRAVSFHSHSTSVLKSVHPS